jgi:hypothetical protein
MTELKPGIVKLREDMILERAQELIQEGWCQHGFAKTELGEEVWPDEDEATEFCATGAIIRAMHELDIGLKKTSYGGKEFNFSNPYYINVCQRLMHAIGPVDMDDDWQNEDSVIMVWNDSMMKSSEDVVLAFKRALYEVG